MMMVHIIRSKEEEFVYEFKQINRVGKKMVFIPSDKDIGYSNEDLMLEFNTNEDAKRVFELALCFMSSDSTVFDVDMYNYFDMMKIVRSKLDAIKRGL